jgi:hypothetical protein
MSANELNEANVATGNILTLISQGYLLHALTQADRCQESFRMILAGIF